MTVAKDSELPIEFPLGGIDVSKEFQLQPPGTTSSAANVRATDAIALRRRGGSRPGLAKYVEQQLPGWTSGEDVQHLNVIVDPTTAAITQNFDTPDDTWVEHPRFPGVFVPPGGGGNQPNPNATQGEDPTAEISLEQSFTAYFPTGSGGSEEFVSAVGSARFFTAVVVTETNTANVTVTVENGASDAYTQVGSYVRFSKGGEEYSLSVWRFRGDNGLSDRAIRVTPSAECGVRLAGFEWGGVNVTTPVGDTASNSGLANPMTAGEVTVTADDEAVLAAFVAAASPDTVTPGAGYTLEIDVNDGSPDGSNIQLYVIYRLGVDPPASETPEATFALGADNFVAMALTIVD